MTINDNKKHHINPYKLEPEVQMNTIDILRGALQCHLSYIDILSPKLLLFHYYYLKSIHQQYPFGKYFRYNSNDQISL